MFLFLCDLMKDQKKRTQIERSSLPFDVRPRNVKLNLSIASDFAWLIFFKICFLINNTNITYNNSIAITTYTNNTNNIANDTDITYNTIDTYNKY